MLRLCLPHPAAKRRDLGGGPQKENSNKIMLFSFLRAKKHLILRGDGHKHDVWIKY